MRRVRMPRICGRGGRGFALVSALLLGAFLATALTALVAMLSVDRAISWVYLARARAGLAAEAALADIVGALGRIGDRAYACAWEPGEGEGSDRGVRPVLCVLEGGRIIERIALDSGEPGEGADGWAQLRADGVGNAGDGVRVGYRSLRGDGCELARYAFWVEDEGAKQQINLARGGAREWLMRPGEIPLVSPDGRAVAPEESAALGARGWIPRVDCLGHIAPRDGARWDEAEYTVRGRALCRDPEGRARLDLYRLKRFVDGFALSQARGNPRARLIERLLAGEDAGASEWGGGDLRILARLYPPVRARQVAANLIDWIDADIIPTTDDIECPTYFGCEGRAGVDGDAWGHPWINFVGTGLVFNRSRSGAQAGALNSTRVLAFLGVANPWPIAGRPWEMFYRPEIRIEIGGRASGGTCGPEARAYFDPDLGERLADSPVTRLAPYSGACCPGAPGGPAYASFRDLLGTVGRQPPGMRFDGVHYRIRRLRLWYVGSDGAEGCVQALDRLGEIAVPGEPGAFQLGTAGGALLYKFTAQRSKRDLHLCGDPRLSFLPSTWRLARSIEVGTRPPMPDGARIDLFDGVREEEMDGRQGARGDPLWYTDRGMRNHLAASSPPAIDGDAGGWAVRSIGELGFLHGGIPWRTLRLHGGSGESRDWEIVGYVCAGTWPTRASDAIAGAGLEAIEGALDVNTAGERAWRALFHDLPGWNDGRAGACAARLTRALRERCDRSGPVVNVGEIARSLDPGGDEATDFGREEAFRRIANALEIHSLDFTALALGEAREGGRTVARVLLRARIGLHPTARDGGGWRLVPRVERVEIL